MKPHCYQPRPFPRVPDIARPTMHERILLTIIDSLQNMVLEERSLVAALQLQTAQQAALVTRTIDEVTSLEGEMAVLYAHLAELQHPDQVQGVA